MRQFRPITAFILLFAPTWIAAQTSASQAPAEGSTMMENLEAATWWMTEDVVRQLISTLLLVLAIYLLRRLAVRRIAAMTDRPMEVRRQLIVAARNGSLALLAVGLVIVWATELRALAISLVAIIAAIVLATKELILCLTGGLYRILSKNCAVGDRIEVNTMRGDIIDTGLLHTTVLEIGPAGLTQQHTGRALVIPNVVFLTAPVYNETYTREYVAHTITVPLGANDDWQRAEQVLLDAANAEVSEFIEEAKRHLRELQELHGLAAPAADPRVVVKIPDAGKVMLVLRVPAPARRKGRIEQNIIRRFLSEFYQKKGDQPAKG